MDRERRITGYRANLRESSIDIDSKKGEGLTVDIQKDQVPKNELIIAESGDRLGGDSPMNEVSHHEDFEELTIDLSSKMKIQMSKLKSK